jgi:O-antigen/teichoic acid export membrane protein
VVARYAGVNYLATLASDAARFALPVLVLLHVSARVNASFYVAWGITLVAFLVPVTIGQVLLAEGPKAAERASAQVRVALLLSVSLMAVASVVAWLFADVVVSVYGSGYREAARILPTLMAAGVPWAVTSIALADARIRRDNRATLVITLALGLAVLGPALVLVPDRGVDGATAAWLSGNVVAAVIGAGVTLRHRLRARPA